MREYFSGYFTDRFSYEQKRNIFLIMDDAERTHLASLIHQLEHDIPIARKAKIVTRWTKKDKEAVEFLKRCTHYGAFPESEMIDWTEDQIMTLICKTLDKVYADKFDATKTSYFATWSGFRINGTLSHGQCKQWMETKREMHRKFKAPKITTPAQIVAQEQLLY